MAPVSDTANCALPPHSAQNSRRAGERSYRVRAGRRAVRDALRSAPAEADRSLGTHDRFGEIGRHLAPVVLPPHGLLDELGYQNGLKDQLFTVVGYGANERIEGDGPPTFLRDLNRRYATSGLNSLGQALMRLSMNREKGFGGASFGDSGGAIFLGQSNTAVAIVGLRSTDVMYQGYRLDIPSARAFLSNFVTLPN